MTSATTAAGSRTKRRTGNSAPNTSADWPSAVPSTPPRNASSRAFRSSRSAASSSSRERAAIPAPSLIRILHRLIASARHGGREPSDSPFPPFPCARWSALPPPRRSRDSGQPPGRLPVAGELQLASADPWALIRSRRAYRQSTASTPGMPASHSVRSDIRVPGGRIRRSSTADSAAFASSGSHWTP